MRTEFRAALSRRKVSPDPKRIFYGPCEGRVGEYSREIAIDQFGEYVWVTAWCALLPAERDELAEVLSSHFRGGVWIDRPEQELPPLPQVLFGHPPAEGMVIEESGVRYWIQLLGQRHPGLFLDHAPLRRRLAQGDLVRGKTVLNTFAYTGSLSLAALRGGAAGTLTLDLSRPTIEWAKKNLALNDFSGNSVSEKADFIFGDTFEWLKKFAKKGRRFDVVILDPPSFSRAGSRRFSTAKDLVELHRLAVDCLNSGGLLLSSINSANVPREQYESQVSQALRQSKRKYDILSRISLDVEFTGIEIPPAQSYLKGWIARVS